MTFPEYVKQNRSKIEEHIRFTFPNAIIEGTENVIKWMVLMDMVVEAHQNGVSKASCRYWFRRFGNE